jgi:hypothetical protein
MARSKKNKMKCSGPGSIASKKGVRKQYKKLYKTGKLKK